jgi:hypothetical protein
VIAAATVIGHSICHRQRRGRLIGDGFSNIPGPPFLELLPVSLAADEGSALCFDGENPARNRSRDSA